jgi:hypothetical protein
MSAKAILTTLARGKKTLAEIEETAVPLPTSWVPAYDVDVLEYDGEGKFSGVTLPDPETTEISNPLQPDLEHPTGAVLIPIKPGRVTRSPESLTTPTQIITKIEKWIDEYNFGGETTVIYILDADDDIIMICHTYPKSFTEGTKWEIVMPVNYMGSLDPLSAIPETPNQFQFETASELLLPEIIFGSQAHKNTGKATHTISELGTFSLTGMRVMFLDSCDPLTENVSIDGDKIDISMENAGATLDLAGFLITFTGTNILGRIRLANAGADKLIVTGGNSGTVFLKVEAKDGSNALINPLKVNNTPWSAIINGRMFAGQVAAQSTEIVNQAQLNDTIGDLADLIKELFGRNLFLANAFKVSVFSPEMINDCELTTNWNIIGTGALALDSADYYEGANSLSVTGHDAATELQHVGVFDLSAYNGVILATKATSTDSITVYLEDSSGNRAKWFNQAIDATWAELEIKLESPDESLPGAIDLANVVKIGISNLDPAIGEYNVDALQRARFNDFKVDAGIAMVEGGMIENEAQTTYFDHLQDWQGGGSVTALNPPGSGTRTDFVYIDASFQLSDQGIKPVLALEVSDQELSDYVDGETQHYRVKIASLERDTSQKIHTLTDIRNWIRHDSTKGLLIALNDTLDMFTLKGGIDCSTNPNYPEAQRGHTYKAITAGKIGGASGKPVESGDSIVCYADDSPGGDEAAVGGDWFVVQANLEFATNEETAKGLEAGKIASPANIAYVVLAGMIAAYNPGYYTDAVNGGFTLALGIASNDATGVNAYINPRGWYVCDGAELNDPDSPIWNAAGRYLPNLTDERFIQGSTSCGGTGGSNKMLDHTHTHSLAANSAGAHTHSLANTRTLGQGSTTGTALDVPDSYAGIEGHWPTTSAGAHTHAISGSIGIGSAPASTDCTPKYLSTFMIIKVK